MLVSSMTNLNEKYLPEIEENYKETQGLPRIGHTSSTVMARLGWGSPPALPPPPPSGPGALLAYLYTMRSRCKSSRPQHSSAA